jgi:transketolase
MAANDGDGASDMRDAFSAALIELGRERKDVIVLDADLNTSSKTVGFMREFPTRFIQVGIAEQDLMGIAAGLALEGFIPFPSTFAVFATRRALDQIAISIAYPALNVKIPGSYAGLPTSRAGASHIAIEDLAIMRALPNMRVADPGSNVDLRAVIRTAVETPGPVYFRITRVTIPELFGSDHRFEWGRGEVLRRGRDVTLFGTGMMSWLCGLAADILAKDGIDAEVIHLASVKPIDADLIVASVARTRCAVTAENASIVGGFGAAVLEALAEESPVPLVRVGVRDKWVDSGSTDDLFAHHQMNPENIAAAARRAIAARDGATVRSGSTVGAADAIRATSEGKQS